jgi:hypothetical protein
MASLIAYDNWISSFIEKPPTREDYIQRLNYLFNALIDWSSTDLPIPIEYMREAQMIALLLITKI